MKLAMNSKAKRKLAAPVVMKVPYVGYNLVIKPMFDYTIMACIMINVVVMASGHFDQSVPHHTVLTISNWLFNIIFTVEMLTKWWGIDPVLWRQLE